MNKTNLYILEPLQEAIAKMPSIKHLDELNTDDFITFVKNFIDIETRNVEVSEKVDGQNFSFGVDEKNKFFSKTKTSNPVTDSSVYGEFSFMQGVRDFHDTMKRNTRSFVLIKDFIANEMGIDSNFAFQVFGELLPNSQTNIVKYDSEKIGNGAVVLFDIMVDGKSMLQQRWSSTVFQMLVKELDKKGGWRVYSKPLIDPKSFKFNVNHLITLESLYRKYYDIMKSRKKADKPTKEKAKRVIQMVMDNIKAQFLRNMVANRKSVLGGVEPEGLILRDFSNNLLIKLVDKDSFTVDNQAGSQYIKPVMVQVGKTKKAIKDDIFGNADIIKNFAKVIEKAADWAFTQRQLDPNFKVQSLDDLLMVAYNDMVKEKRIKYKAPEAIKKSIVYLRELGKVVDEQDKELEKGKADIPESKYLISREKMDAYRKSVDETISQLQSISKENGIKVYLTLMAFVFGDGKIRELKSTFNLNEENIFFRQKIAEYLS